MLINVGSNLAGFFLVQLLLSQAYPLQALHRMSALDREANLVLLGFLLPVSIFILTALASPVNRVLKSLEEGNKIPDDSMNAAGRRAVNIPFQAALMNLVAWIIPSVAFPLLFKMRIPGSALSLGVSIVYNFTNAVMIVLMAFILLEQACRRTAIPKLFPKGRIKDQEKTLKLTIRSKLIIVYCAICLIPMFQTALIMNSDTSQTDPAAALAHLGAFSLILFSFVGIYGLWLALLFARNISGPAHDIMDITEKIAGGDYEARVEVTSNDEIGYLGDRVNEMARGLKERERIRGIFNLFTSPEISREILSGKTFAGGEIRRVTLLFSDLRGFTAMAERYPPEQVLDSINSYFDAMSAAIVDHGGIILQYVGDEIEAVFGAPLDDPNHADKAVAAALDMRARLTRLNEERSGLSMEPLNHGIGIHTGHALAGIVGSKYKISYALVGDTVNLASRIQELNKEMDSDILISSDTYESLRISRIVSQPLTVSVKGKSKAVDVFRLIA